MEEKGRSRSRTYLPALAGVALLTGLGAALRIGEIDQSLFGDELWSAAVSNSPNLGSVIDFVQSDQEISPPLFALLAWLSAKLGDAETLIRLPSLVAGVALIPLVWLIGWRTVGSRAALVATAIAALSPFLIFYSVEARAYALAAALVAASTVAMLTASRRGAWGWWAAYGAFSCLAMYAHYTAFYALLAQFVWLVWQRRTARLPALLANLGAVVAYLPWVSSLIGDLNSPSQGIVGFIAPFSLSNFTGFTAQASLGVPLAGFHDFLGTGLETALFAGIALGLVGTTIAARRKEISVADVSPDQRLDGILLPVMLALACPVGVGLVSLLATDQFLPRNLVVSWPGFAVTLAAIVTRGPRVAWIPATAVVVGVFAVNAIRTTEPEWSRPDIGAAARMIEADSEPNVVVVDGIRFGGGGPVPVALGLEMNEPFRWFAPQDLAPALEAAAGSKLALVGEPSLVDAVAAGSELANLTPTSEATFPGLIDTEVRVYAIPAEGPTASADLGDTIPRRSVQTAPATLPPAANTIQGA